MSRAEWVTRWQEAYDAACDAGAPNPRACADRYMQGLMLGMRLRGGVV